MRKLVALSLIALFFAAALSHAYVEAPYSLGQVIKESTNIVLVEVTKVDKNKNLIVYKKLEDIKGKHPTEVIKHNIGKNGFHPREWQNVIAWAEEGKKAIFFHNGGASETCIGTYWYQCYPQGEWWGMSHAEPFLLRTYCGNPEKLAAACKAILGGQEIVVPCMADGNKELLHQRKAKMQMMKASLKRGNYDAKRDFVAFGTGDDDYDVPEYKTTILLPQTTGGWKFLPAKEVTDKHGDKWREVGFDDKDWRVGQTPIGHGQDEITKRKGTLAKEMGVPFVFRKTVEVPQEVLATKGVKLQMGVASDDSADVYFNGVLVDHDPVLDHDFEYWNREFEIPLKLFKPGTNTIAVFVRNHKGSHDIYLDMELAALVELPKKKPVKPANAPGAVAPNEPGAPKGQANAAAAADDKTPPKGLKVDKEAKTVTLDCKIAPRKLPHLAQIYPIEVIACYPHPKGQKAHETVITFEDVKPSQIHKAMEDLGLKPGKPAKGENAKASGPEVKFLLEFTGADGKMKRLPFEQILVDIKSGKPIKPLTWHFTGSIMKNIDPEKDDKVYAADYSGTLIGIFPVTDELVFQAHLTLKEEAEDKMEIAKDLLPKEGSPAKLIIQVK
ncbi:hypothetical protein AYO44_10080 [Planctomycetaceae bacterium SCGC AG-212-F19]|nr:hypothetical protein AYO44_10080 [Planctomycetaceae bacterium SCGC AG-212-F19]